MLALEVVDGFADADLDAVGQAGVIDVGLGDLGVCRLELQGDESAVGGQGAGEADGAVACERADLEDFFRAGRECQDM